MSILDRILGRRPEPTSGTTRRADPRPPTAESPSDEQAIERYRYLLRTAPPEAIEETHAEAFAQLTPAQRRLLLESLNGELPPQERTDRDDPRSLARVATRAELRRPGTLERTFGGVYPNGAAVGAGGLLASNFLNTIAAVVVGSAIADAFFGDGSYAEGYQDGVSAADVDQGADGGDAGFDGGDTGYDAGGDIGGDFGSDIGGGEF